MYKLSNIHLHQKDISIVVRQRKTGSNSSIQYRLTRPLSFQLSTGMNIHIHRGFTWDLSSVPRVLWGLLPPDGDFEVAALIHDFLYIHNKQHYLTRKQCDDEMLKWSKVVSGTQNRISIRNFDNQLRYIVVRLFGHIIWNRNKKK